jgi:integrase
MSAAQSLAEYLNSYALFHPLKRGSLYQLGRTIDVFSIFLAAVESEAAAKENRTPNPRVALPADLNDETASKWIMWCETRYAPATIKRMRGDLLTIWRAFADDNAAHPTPRKVRKVDVPEPDPQVWSREEVERLLRAADRIPGVMKNGCERSVYYRAIILAAWGTGLRRGDLWTLRLDQITKGGFVAKRQNKTGDKHYARLQPEAVEAIELIGGETPLAWPYSPRMFYYWWDKLKAIAGVTSDGSLQKLRCSSSTNVAIHQPGKQTKFLGHTTPKADANYVPGQVLAGEPVEPEPLTVRNTKGSGIIKKMIARWLGKRTG